jgi:NAD-dependent histone deacetylase SIR2
MDLITPPSSQVYVKDGNSTTHSSDSEQDQQFKQEDVRSAQSQSAQVPTTRRKPQKRKPKLRYRPENGTVLNISSYDRNVSILEQDYDIDNEDVSFLHYALKYSKKIAVVTGAGISVASGIPDFRSSNGLFQGLKSTTSAGSNGRALFDSSVYSSGETTAKFHAMINQLHNMTQESEPTEFHRFLDEISSDGRLLRHYTQNIDCLESKLQNLGTTVPIKQTPPYPPTIQLHGTIQHMYCSKCRWNSEIQVDLFEGDEPPACPECIELDEIRKFANKRSQGIGCLRPRIVLYNEFHPDGEQIGQISTTDLKSKPDCLIIAGTSLKIPGVRRLVKELAKAVHASKGCVIWINKDEPSMSIVDYVENIDLIVSGDCQDISSIVESYDLQLKSKSKKKEKKSDTGLLDPPTKVRKSYPKVKKEGDLLIQSRLEELVTKLNQQKNSVD